MVCAANVARGCAGNVRVWFGGTQWAARERRSRAFHPTVHILRPRLCSGSLVTTFERPSRAERLAGADRIRGADLLPVCVADASNAPQWPAEPGAMAALCATFYRDPEY